MSGRLRSRVKTERPAQSAPPSEFWLPLLDSGSGAVNTTLARGSGSATFTRAGATATTVLSTGLVSSTIAANTARSYYDPTTLQYLGYLAEEARTNLCLQSADFSTSWTRVNILAFGSGSVVNSLASPDGTTTADTITEDSTAAVQHYLQAATIAGLTASTVYTASCFFKSKERTRGRIVFCDSATVDGVTASFNLSTGTITATSTTGAGTLTASGIQAFPNGWYRVWVAGAMNNAKTNGTVLLNLADASGNVSYNGDGASGMYFWGAQLEAGAFPTSYIPTAAATSTRAADVMTFPGAGNISQTQGTCFMRWQKIVPNTTSFVALSLDDGTANEIIYAFGTSAEPTVPSMFVADGGATQANFTAPTTVAYNTSARVTTVYEANNFKCYANGSAAGTDTSGTLPTTTTIRIGSNATGGQVLNGTIRDIRIWQRVLSDSQIASIL